MITQTDDSVDLTPEMAAFKLVDVIEHLVRSRVLTLRRLDVADAAIRDAVLTRAIDRAPYGAYGVDAEYNRETAASWVVRALDAALKAPDDPTLNAESRMHDEGLEGDAVVLGNGESWYFPLPELYLPILGDHAGDSKWALPLWRAATGRDQIGKARPELIQQNVVNLLLTMNYKVGLPQIEWLIPLSVRGDWRPLREWPKAIAEVPFWKGLFATAEALGLIPLGLAMAEVAFIAKEAATAAMEADDEMLAEWKDQL